MCIRVFNNTTVSFKRGRQNKDTVLPTDGTQLARPATLLSLNGTVIWQGLETFKRKCLATPT